MSKFDPNKPRRGRPAGETKEVKKSFLIFCEGQTEAEYFRHFQIKNRIPTITIIPIELSEQGNALTLVNEAVRRKNEGQNYDEYWILFDKDETRDEDFIKAINICQENEIQAAYSIQAFELWILLHYAFIEDKMNRKLYEEKINQYLKTCKYGKSKEELKKVYDEIFPNLAIAIKNAKKGFDNFESSIKPIPQRESSTLVFKLVEKLLKQGK